MKLAATFFERVHASAAVVAERLDADGAEVAVVLGSGLAAVADHLEKARSAVYASLPGFPETTVAGHPGRVVVGTVAGRKVMVLCGRVHGYEGYEPREVGFGVRVAAALGVETLVVTNASGGVDPSLRPGEVVAISDHINLTGGSPLTGPNDERLGPRFADMTTCYPKFLRDLAAEQAPTTLGYPLREAIYAGMAGPSYETPAEVRMLRILGAGLVGMSTVHEVIAARHMGVPVAGVSLVANRAAGLAGQPLTHAEVQEVANRVGERLADLLAAYLPIAVPR
jgi:purine-nucleoside phosphorylase